VDRATVGNLQRTLALRIVGIALDGISRSIRSSIPFSVSQSAQSLAWTFA